MPVLGTASSSSADILGIPFLNRPAPSRVHESASGQGGSSLMSVLDRRKTETMSRVVEQAAMETQHPISNGNHILSCQLRLMLLPLKLRKRGEMVIPGDPSRCLVVLVSSLGRCQVRRSSGTVLNSLFPFHSCFWRQSLSRASTLEVASSSSTNVVVNFTTAPAAFIEFTFVRSGATVVINVQCRACTLLGHRRGSFE